MEFQVMTIRKGNARSNDRIKEKANPRFVALPRYWVPEDEVLRRLDKRENVMTFTRPDQTRPDQTRPDQTRPDQTRPTQRPRRTGSQLALRNITRTTDERTAVSSVIPIVGLGHSGTIVIVGSLFSETLQARPTNERQFLQS